MLSTLSRLSHFNLQVALAGNIIVPILQRSTEMLSDLPKITKLVIKGSRTCNAHQLPAHALRPEQRAPW